MNSDILLFFDTHMDALPLYLRLEEQILAQFPDVRIKIAKSQITFANKYGFVFVSFLPVRKGKDRPKAYITVTFGLGYRKESDRIDAATEPDPGRWTHHIMVSSLEELDEELFGWIWEAAHFSADK